jgi:DNA-binding protein HU-beta
MNKKDIAGQLAERAGIPHIKATAILNHLFNAGDGIVADALNGGDKVLLAGFGTFEVKTRKGRTGTNPATGARINIPAKNYVAFKPGKTLRERVEQ